MRTLNIFFIFIFLIKVNAQTPSFPFPKHTTYTTGTIKPNNFTQIQLDNQVKSFYDSWKTTYLKPHCTDPSQYYIEFSATGNKCVSEGQGYGMVIVAYMAGYDVNAKTEFDGLYKWVKQHPSNINPLLMNWRQGSSCQSIQNDAATDGDLNIAFALLLADKQWGSTGIINYLQDAINIINAIKTSSLFLPTNSVKLGDWATGNNYANDTRSSDLMTSHFRTFQDVTSDITWTNVLEKSFSIINTIQTNNSAISGLLPDFIENCDSTPIPAVPGFLEGPNDGFYAYNACRVPWNLGVDYALYGDVRAKTACDKINIWLKSTTSNNINNIQSGYKLDGSTNGQNYRHLAFMAPFTVGAMVNASNQTWLNNLWSYLVNAPIDNFGNGYYGDVIKMYSMIIVSGNYWAPQSATLNTKNNVFIENSIEIYPNPSNEICTLKFSLLEDSNIKLNLIDTAGKIIYSENYNSFSKGVNSITLDVRKFSKGNYFCQIISKKSKTVRQIVIE
ncbi:glycosyl hydrolase family 8 [Flavobacterium sp.]|uniref:glycosyl hydrolase family 8 n=1 Tax=Flavobacterium sp. TaxID=239 RepID=UPI00286D7250|nr:glycosyl hydrolase family 8 [Flavobacterium sp.]